MIVLQVNGVTKSFGANSILANIKLEVKANDRIALVGRNGAGKSTLLKMITGELESDSGEITIPKNVDIGYLPQRAGIESERSIWLEMLSVFQPLIQMEKKLRNMELKMGDPELATDTKAYQQLLKDYDKLQIEFKDRGGYRYEADIRSVLHGLKFDEFDYEKTIVSTLSGGQKTRLALAKLLLKKPKLLILDEPTNHLDIETLTWLEEYLQSYPGALLIVSHDRYFLDHLVTTIYEISHGQSTKYMGNYSQYLLEKAHRQEKEWKEFKKQQADIKKMEDFIQKNIARAATAKRAQSRRKQLEKMDRLERPLGEEKSAKFSFMIEKESGKDVLKIANLAVAYGEENPVFANAELRVTKQESVALVGRNGAGKSTLLKAIMKRLPYNGSIEIGTNVHIGYYDQEQANLTANKSVLQALWDHYPMASEKDIRSVLGSLLFSGDDVFKLVQDLSGGEKARLAFAKLMLQKANFLILDEPTNHLDLDSKEVLEQALINYPGTILFASHDRYLINRLATRIVELKKDGTSHYLGNYDDYLEKKNEQKASSAQDKKAQTRHDHMLNVRRKAERTERKQRRQIQEIEETIESLEQHIKQAEKQLYEAGGAGDYEKAGEINKDIEKTNKKLAELMDKWEDLQEKINT